MQGSSVWGMLEFVFNGIIFLLLGLQLPAILGNARADIVQAGGGEPWWLAVYVLAITLALVLLRFVWVWLTVRANRLLARLRRRPMRTIGPRLMWVTALSGVRGAITLAGVLSLPLALADGSPFPARDLMIFLAAGVILATLVLGSAALPILLRKLELPEEDPRVGEERLAREHAAQAALRALEQHAYQLGKDADEKRTALVSRVANRVSADYRQRIEAAGEDGEVPQQARQEAHVERELRLAALRAEREELYRLRRHYLINDQTQRALVRELDLAEASLTGLGPDVH
jgi:CPA1 family monovalent cation:H+ antiporter